MLDREKIKRLRHRAGLSASEAAKRAGMKTFQRWQEVESGAKADPRISTVVKVAKALGVRVDDLLRG